MIRPATPADAPAIAQVHVTSWRETYRGIVPDSYLDALCIEKRTEHWTGWLTKGIYFAFVAEVEGKIVGFVSGGKNQRPELGIDGELAAIYLLKAYQKQGIGRALFEAMQAALKEKQFQQMSLWVIPENPTANFYINMGGTYSGDDNFELGGKTIQEHLYVWQLQTAGGA